MSSGEKKPKVRKKTPPQALTKPHKNKKKYNRKEKRKDIDEVIKLLGFNYKLQIINKFKKIYNFF